MQYSDLIDRFTAFLPRFLGALPLVLAVVVATFLLNLLVGRALVVVARRTSLTALDILPVRRIARWLIRLLGAILILNIFGFEIGGIWAVLSTILGLVAIGFVAVWSIISHTSATVLILLMHPFQIGDDVEFPGETVRGRVVNINFFFTTLIDHEGVLYQIPNNLFFQKTLRRRRNQRIVSLAAQLHADQPASVELPPPPPSAASGAAAAKPEPADAMMNTPDPKTLAPAPRR